MSAPKDSSVSLCGKLGIKPLTCSNVFYYYLPLQGALSYTALSVNVMNPSLILRIFPRRDITNVLLVNSLVGSGFFLYSRPHISGLPKHERILYSAFGALSFSLGSVLIWAILRSIVPQNVALCTVAGVGSGLAMIKIGTNYAAHCDGLVVVKKDTKA